MELFHGSTNIVKKPIYGYGKKYNDYGLGFYCTESIELAKEWGVDEFEDGYANRYEINTDNLKILDLTSKKYSVLNWITLLINNRTFNLKNDIAKEGKKFLSEHYMIDISKYDIVKGYRADDSYFLYAEDFLNNIISLNKLEYSLKLGKMGEQVVLISKQAFEEIKFIEAIKADKNIYYPKRKLRINKARVDYIKAKTKKISINDIFLSDLIRGRVL